MCPAARVRPLADEDAVAPGRVRGVLHGRAHVLLVAEVHERGSRESGVGAALALDVDRAFPLARREVGHRDAVDHELVPLDRHVVEAVRAGLLELDAQPLAQTGIAQPPMMASGPPACTQAGSSAWR